MPAGRPKGSKNKKINKNIRQLKLALFPVGRPKGSGKIKPSKQVKGMRLKSYSNVLSSEGTIVSVIADQYGRVMEQYINEENRYDIRPTGQCIAARH